MGKVKVIFGSTTGCTEGAAQKIAAAFETEAVNVANATASDFDADLLILGTSTWGIGELQDDWVTNLSLLKKSDLKGKKVAIFGFGDQSGFGDTYCDAMAILANTASQQGGELIGKTSAEGYSHSASNAVVDGMFCGLALDENNQSDKTPGRIEAWIAQLKKEQ